MIEMLGVLAIIGVLSAGGIMGYSKAMEAYKFNKFVNDTKTMVGNALALFLNPHKGTISVRWQVPTLNKLGIVPDDIAATYEERQPYGYVLNPFTGNKDWRILLINLVFPSNLTINVVGFGECIVSAGSKATYLEYILQNTPKNICIKRQKGTSNKVP